jgi:hypothetical protein
MRDTVNFSDNEFLSQFACMYVCMYVCMFLSMCKIEINLRRKNCCNVHGNAVNMYLQGMHCLCVEKEKYSNWSIFAT